MDTVLLYATESKAKNSGDKMCKAIGALRDYLVQHEEAK
jgi:hypothetical protein